MKKIIFIFCLLPYLSYSQTKSEVTDILFFDNIFGHVHQNPLKYSSSLTTVSCGHPVKILGNFIRKNDWYQVKVGEYVGFIHKKFLKKKKPQCFQSKYPKFFNKLNLDLTQLYYWGRLYDHYLMDKSKAQ